VKAKEWLAFIGLSLAWGSSFLWIKIAVTEIGPWLLVALRVLFGLIGLALVVLWKRPEWPKDRKQLWSLLLLGLTNTAVPFVLISWAEQYIDSAVASILNSSVPLFTMLIAHFVLSDDKMTRQRVLGLIVGFIGVVVLTLRDVAGPAVSAADRNLILLAQGAMILAVIFYAGSSVYARHSTKGISPIVQAMVPLVSANAIMWSATFYVESPIVLPVQTGTWIALLWLGIVGSCLAYLFYYYLIHSIGPTRATMVTYVFPVIGVTLGVVYLQERLDASLILGGLLVLLSLFIVNRRVTAPVRAR
jgi:drug/metabolite transporter (DMT)-like permease